MLNKAGDSRQAMLNMATSGAAISNWVTSGLAILSKSAMLRKGGSEQGGFEQANSEQGDHESTAVSQAEPPTKNAKIRVAQHV